MILNYAANGLVWFSRLFDAVRVTSWLCESFLAPEAWNSGPPFIVSSYLWPEGRNLISVQRSLITSWICIGWVPTLCLQAVPSKDPSLQCIPLTIISRVQTPSSQKKSRVRKKMLGPEMAAPILLRLEKLLSFSRTTSMLIKFLVLGGGGVSWVFGGGGGECRFYFYGHGEFFFSFSLLTLHYVY